MCHDHRLSGLRVPHLAARLGIHPRGAIGISKTDVVLSPRLLVARVEGFEECFGTCLVGNDVKTFHEPDHVVFALELVVSDERHKAFEDPHCIVNGLGLVGNSRRPHENTIEVCEEPLLPESQPCFALDGRGKDEQRAPDGEERCDLLAAMTIDAIGEEAFSSRQDLITWVRLPEGLFILGFIIGFGSEVAGALRLCASV